jgi:hypothetical protein
MADYRGELEQLDWAIEEGAHRIDAQRARIAELKRDGKDTAAAVELLRVLETNLDLTVARREMIKRHIGDG